MIFVSLVDCEVLSTKVIKDSEKVNGMIEFEYFVSLVDCEFLSTKATKGSENFSFAHSEECLKTQTLQ